MLYAKSSSLQLDPTISSTLVLVHLIGTSKQAVTCNHGSRSLFLQLPIHTSSQDFLRIMLLVLPPKLLLLTPTPKTPTEPTYQNNDAIQSPFLYKSASNQDCWQTLECLVQKPSYRAL
jgi:hypothetical protein